MNEAAKIFYFFKLENCYSIIFFPNVINFTLSAIAAELSNTETSSFSNRSGGNGGIWQDG
jgi:hypothetical protein